MKKNIFLLLAVLLSVPMARSQSTALDFTMNDCSGINHHLYSELDSGYVIVLDYIMLSCASCIVGTNGLKAIVNQYSTSHPGRVRLYSFGFLNEYTCPQLNSWMNSGGFTHKMFNNGNTQVNYYGGMGMPTVVVVSGNEYHVEYKKLGYSSSDDNSIIAAINKGLLFTPVAIDENPTSSSVSINPTVFGNRIYVSDPNNKVISLKIFNMQGSLVTTAYHDGFGDWSIDLPSLPPGIYLAQVNTIDGVEQVVKLVSAGL